MKDIINRLVTVLDELDSIRALLTEWYEIQNLAVDLEGSELHNPEADAAREFFRENNERVKNLSSTFLKSPTDENLKNYKAAQAEGQRLWLEWEQKEKPYRVRGFNAPKS